VGRSHLVWDWNGTLLDDLPIVVEAVNRSIAMFDVGPIDADGYRDHYTRPVRHFYDNLFGRVVADEEWLRLNTMFHDVYFDLATDADLAPGAREAIRSLEEAGWGQSLLSMSPQDWLSAIVDICQNVWATLSEHAAKTAEPIERVRYAVHPNRLAIVTAPARALTRVIPKAG